MHQYIFDSGDVGLTAATAKTVCQLVTGSTRRSKILEIGVSFSSVTATDAPVLVELMTQSADGTATGAATIRKVDPADPTAIQTANASYSAEPTTSTATGVGPWRVTPVGGLFVYQWPEGEELMVPVSTRIGLRLTSPATQSNVRAYIKYQE